MTPKKLLIVAFYLYSSVLFGQGSFQIKGVKTILQLNTESNYLVILVHGSGRQDMEGTVVNNSKTQCFYRNYANKEFKIFNDISWKLNDLGFSTLRYDKLSFRNSTTKDFMIDDFAADLNEILLKVSQDSILKDKKLILFGWSEGVTVALKQLKYQHNFAGMILYGGVFVDPIIMKADLYYQLYAECEGNVKKAVSYRDQFIKQITEPTEDQNDAYDDRIEFKDTLLNENKTKIIGISSLKISYKRAYFLNFKEEVFNSIKNISQADIPMLVIHGDADVNVPIKNHVALRNKFENKNNMTFKILHDSDHFMRKNFNTDINDVLFKQIAEWARTIE